MPRQPEEHGRELDVEKFVQPASAIRLIGRWDLKREKAVPRREEELRERQRKAGPPAAG
jgi:hypothetical protein